MRKIGIDKRDPEYRHFYYDDSNVLTSNPPKYKIWYVDDENDIDYIECSKVLKIKDAPVENKYDEINVIKNAEKLTEMPITASQKEDVVKVSGDAIKEQPEAKKRGRKKKVAEDIATIKIENKESEQTTIGQLVQEPVNRKFEYTAFNIDFSDINEFVGILDDYGNDGWELCTSEIYSESIISNKKKIFCIMKRIKGLE